MRKYLIGGLVGLCIGLSATAYADDVESLVGKTIQGESSIIVDGQVVDKAVIVDGKSYAPVRNLLEGAGYNVDYAKQQIVLTKPEAVQTTTEPMQPTTDTTGGETVPDTTTTTDPSNGTGGLTDQEKITRGISMIEDSLKSLNVSLTQAQYIMANSPDASQDYLDKIQTQIDNTKAQIATLEQKKAELEAQLNAG